MTTDPSDGLTVSRLNSADLPCTSTPATLGVGDGPGADAVEGRVAHQLAPIRAVGAEAAVPSTSPRASCR